MARETFVLRSNLDSQMESLTDDEFGKLMRKVFKYVKGESSDLLSEKLELVFGFIKADIDKNAEKYEETCRKRKEAAQARWQKTANANVYNSMQNMQMHNLHYDNEYEYDYEYDNEYDNKLSKDNYDINIKKENLKEKNRKQALKKQIEILKNKPKAQLFDYDWFEDVEHEEEKGEINYGRNQKI